MVEQTLFRGVIEFFGRLGVYDIILPFLLVFTLVYAILEKSKILGIEKYEGKEYTRKNLNAIIAFVIGFIVVASSQLVSIINEVLGKVILLLLVGFCFMLLIGTFYSGEKEVFLEGGWQRFFMVLMFIGVVLIFLQTLGWLAQAFNWISKNWSGEIAGSIILVLIIVGFIYFITKEKRPVESKKE